MPKRISPADTMSRGTATPVRVVIVTMDSHLSGAAARARTALRRDFPGLDLVVHAADAWGSDESALARCHADIARGDIIIATMLFLEDHVRAVMPALVARRDCCDAMIGCMSAAEVVKLTRVGKFDMSTEALGAIAWLKKLRGKKEGRPAGGRGEMAMLRRLPKILRFIPGTAQDMRAYFLTPQYWLAGSVANIAGRPLCRWSAPWIARPCQGGGAGRLRRYRRLSSAHEDADFRPRRGVA
jgi:magnesium chelatase subunit H